MGDGWRVQKLDFFGRLESENWPPLTPYPIKREKKSGRGCPSKFRKILCPYQSFGLRNTAGGGGGGDRMGQLGQAKQGVAGVN